MKINLLKQYPKSKRDLKRGHSIRAQKIKGGTKNLVKTILMEVEIMDTEVLTIIKNFGVK